MKSASLWVSCLLCSLALLAPGTSRADTPRLLDAAQVPTLLQAPTHGVRIVALWSLDCLYCEPNVAALEALHKAHPGQVQLVLVSTDGPARRAAVAERIKAMHATGFPAWVYAQASPQQLNYLIDPQWGGELPRTIVVHADGRRQAVSGLLEGARIKALVGKLGKR